MHLSSVLAQLRRELANLDAAIVSLERLQAQAVRARPRSVAAELLKAQPKPMPVGRRRRQTHRGNHTE